MKIWIFIRTEFDLNPLQQSSFVCKTNIDIQCIPWVPIATGQESGSTSSEKEQMQRNYTPRASTFWYIFLKVFLFSKFNALWDLLSLKGLVIDISQTPATYFCLGFSCCPLLSVLVSGRPLKRVVCKARVDCPLTVFSVFFSPSCNPAKTNRSNEPNKTKTNRDRFLDIF